MSKKPNHLALGEYKGKPQAVFTTVPDPNDVIAHYTQQVSLGAAKCNIMLIALAAAGPAAMLQLLLDTAQGYEPTEQQAKANPGLSPAQVKKVEAAITAATPKGKKNNNNADADEGEGEGKGSTAVNQAA